MANKRTPSFWIEAVCQKCAATLTGRFVRYRIPTKEMADQARKAGWKVINNDWTCDTCAPRLSNKSTEKQS